MWVVILQQSGTRQQVIWQLSRIASGMEHLVSAWSGNDRWHSSSIVIGDFIMRDVYVGWKFHYC